MESRWGSGYAAWIQATVGQPAPPRTWADNPVTGAVAGGSGQFTFFATRYAERVKRLWAALPQDRSKLLEKIANVGTDNWYGYFAELTAWDFFADLPLDLHIEVAPPGPQLGPNTYILDGCLDGLSNLNFDVKALADTTKMVLDGVARQIEKRNPGVSIKFTYPLDLGQSAVSAVRQSLVDDIQAAITSGTPFVKHTASGVDVRIYKPRPLTTVTEHAYNPYQQAQQFRFAALSDARQFVRGAPNLLVYVLHHWFNLNNSNAFAGQQLAFFRSLARRTFCEATRDAQPLANIVVGAPTGLTVQVAAQHLAGIIFLVDHSVLGREGRDPSGVLGTVEAFVYANPNALPACDGRYPLQRLLENAPGRISMHDDFQFDNY